MEFTILPDLLIKKAICDMNMIMCEFHKRFVKDSPNNVTSFLEDYNFITHKVKGCKGRLVDIDDESYGTGDDPSPLPGRIDSAMGRRLTLNGHNNQQKPLKKIHSRVEDSVRNEAEMRIINEFEELRKVNLIV